MDKYRVIKQLQLQEHHRPTGKTRHYLGSQEISAPNILWIVQYSDDPGYYLLYLDAEGQELTDTYHDSIEAAIAQAEREFLVKANEWHNVAS